MARYAGLSDDRGVDEALERVDLTDRGGDKFKAYSLGMKQRLGVASALLGDPELLILDEPTNGLDPAGMADMRRADRRAAAGGQTVVLSSHLLAEVQEICDRVGVINDGRLLEEATVAELRGATTLRVRGDAARPGAGGRHARSPATTPYTSTASTSWSTCRLRRPRAHPGAGRRRGRRPRGGLRRANPRGGLLRDDQA